MIVTIAEVLHRDPCIAGREWLLTQPNLHVAWNNCSEPSWMMWAMAVTGTCNHDHLLRMIAELSGNEEHVEVARRFLYWEYGDEFTLHTKPVHSLLEYNVVNFLRFVWCWTTNHDVPDGWMFETLISGLVTVFEHKVGKQVVMDFIRRNVPNPFEILTIPLFILNYEPCMAARVWLMGQRSMYDAWEACDRADWLMWVLSQVTPWRVTATRVGCGIKMYGDKISPGYMRYLQVSKRIDEGLSTYDNAQAAWRECQPLNEADLDINNMILYGDMLNVPADVLRGVVNNIFDKEQ